MDSILKKPVFVVFLGKQVSSEQLAQFEPYLLLHSSLTFKFAAILPDAAGRKEFEYLVHFKKRFTGKFF